MVGCEVARQFLQPVGAADHLYAIAAPLERPAQGAGKGRIVLDDQQSALGHRVFSSASESIGRISVVSAPPPSRFKASIVPPSGRRTLVAR